MDMETKTATRSAFRKKPGLFGISSRKYVSILGTDSWRNHSVRSSSSGAGTKHSSQLADSASRTKQRTQAFPFRKNQLGAGYSLRHEIRGFRIRAGLFQDQILARTGKVRTTLKALVSTILVKNRNQPDTDFTPSLPSSRFKVAIPGLRSNPLGKRVARQEFKGSLLEPAWLVFIDSIPVRVESGLIKAFTGAKKKPLVSLALVFLVSMIPFLAKSMVSVADQAHFPANIELVVSEEQATQDLLLSYLDPKSGNTEEEISSVPLPALPVSLQTRTYTVRQGDSLASVAKRFGLRQDTIISANRIKNSAGFKVGMQLTLPNMNGVTHTIRSGDTLPAISKKYGVDITRLADVNNLQESILKTGTTLFIPGAKLDASALQGFYAVKMIWPTRGRISSPFGYRANPFTGARTFHQGIDIVVNTGTPIRTMMDGRVSDTGYNGVFGNYVIISHQENYQTLYGHLSSISAKEGQTVSQGAVIGKSGNSGYSTGPHLHFGLFKGGTALNPQKYLK